MLYFKHYLLCFHLIIVFFLIVYTFLYFLRFFEKSVFSQIQCFDMLRCFPVMQMKLIDITFSVSLLARFSFDLYSFAVKCPSTDC